MNESMLNSLMQLFAIMANINRESVHLLARNFVESYLTQQFSARLAEKYLLTFDEYSTSLDTVESKTVGKKISGLSVKILRICARINEELHIRHRFQILLSLIQFSKYFEDDSNTGSGFSNAIGDAVKTVSDGLLINEDEFANCNAFIVDKFYKVPDKENLLVISDDTNFMFTEIRHMQTEGLSGQIFVLRIKRADIYLFQYAGKERLEIGGKYIFPRHVYLLSKGSSIKSDFTDPIYYSDIVAGFLREEEGERLDFLARDISFTFKNSDNGIHKFSFQGNSGQLVGIMGGSGTGKSTLLKVLNGSLKLDSGTIFINGHNLHSEKQDLEGLIGYIPQDDLLIEDLTVYQNLYFNARLCLDDATELELKETVGRVLTELDLFEVRDLKVGTPLHKFISGGQRKRLNIALELIREPYVLFVDEPTSGLSSTDSENVMLLLKEQALKGRLVVVNIHQPSSDLFKLFDHLLVLDRGGYPVYSGNPIEGILYFKELAERVDAGESECLTCGNTNPEEILQIIEARDVDEFGEFSARRKTSPEEWYEQYLERIQSNLDLETSRLKLPANIFKIPSAVRQFLIFFKRNLLAKLADRQFLAISLLVAPVLAVILGFFTKFISGNQEDAHAYVFSLNENIPAYLFMSVIVALFLGLIISAEEIIKDRRILARESFLHLSRASYLLSKVAFLFLLSAIQMFLFVLAGNAILEIRGMTFSFWLVLFSTACFANVLGLNISDGLKSVVAIYIVVPFLLVPQILLAGVIVKFDKLHYRVASHETVPIAGDLMASRWAYEALTVNQFVKNRYQKHFHEVEMRESNVTYDMQFLVPALIQKIEDVRNRTAEDPGSPAIRSDLRTIGRGFESIFLTRAYPGTESFLAGEINDQLADSAIHWLEDYRVRLAHNREILVGDRDAIHEDLKKSLSASGSIVELKRRYYNEKLADFVLNRIDLHKLTEVDGRFIRKMEPVYQYPVSKAGRAHFFASVKTLGNHDIPTLIFNALVLWLMTLLLYLMLQFSWLQRTLDYFGALQRRKQPHTGN